VAATYLAQAVVPDAVTQIRKAAMVLANRLPTTYNDMLLVDTYAITSTAVGLFSDVPSIDWYNHVNDWHNGVDYQKAVNGTQRALSHEPHNLIT
jgi:hypothetical protein